MKLLNILLTAAALLIAQTSPAGDHYYFTKYRGDSGLPNESIISCITDSDGFIWIGTKDGLYRFDGANCMIPGELANSEILVGTVSGLCEDSMGRIWFSTGSGVGYYDRKKDLSVTVDDLKDVMSFSMSPDADGNVWLTDSRTYSVHRWNGADGTVTHFPSTEYLAATGVHVDRNGTVWLTVGGRPSLYTFNKNGNRFRENTVFVDGKQNTEPLSRIRTAGDNRLLVSTSGKKILLVNTVDNTADIIFKAEGGSEIREMLMRAEGEYWIATSNGLVIIRNGSVTEVMKDTRDNHSISGNDLWSMTSDKSGNVWIGTLYNGLNLWQNNHDISRIYYETSAENSLRGQFVRAIRPDSRGNLWIGTEDGGFNRLNLPTGRISSFGIRNGKGERINVQSLAVTGKYVLISTFSDGVMVFDCEKEKVVRTLDGPAVSMSSILVTPDGGILVGSRMGLLRYDTAKSRLVRDDRIGQCYVHDLLVDSSNGLWIGSYGQGLRYIADGKDSPLIISAKSRDPHGLSSDNVTSVFEDSRHRIWVTTEGGGVCCEELGNILSGNYRFTCIGRQDGMNSNVCSAVAEDSEGNIWVSSSRGIMMIDGQSLQVREILYGKSRIIGDQYSYDASFTTRDGYIYFGTTQGLFGFSPEKIRSQMATAPLYITSITAETGHNRTELHEKGKSALESDIVKVRSKDISSLSISYALTEFSVPQAIVYRYTLRKGKNTVTGLTTDGNIRFFDIHPGHYTINIGLMGPGDTAPEKNLKVIVRPPFYRSVTAEVFYFLLTVLLMAGIVHFMIVRKDAKRAEQIGRIENEKQKEIFNAKISFFTNITHELRTPLTLIKMPLDKIIDRKDYTPTSMKDLLTIQANTNRILTLTNQLLDMRKMDSSEKKLRFIRRDICKVVAKTCSYFDQSAIDQHIRISTEIPDEPVIIPCAEDVISAIVSNLLSNAVKYGDGDIRLKLSHDGALVRIRVNSNGKLIPVNESENIFKIFYQLDNDPTVRKSNGTGLGLPYARSMARLHNGNLYLDTEERSCNSFVLEIPTVQLEQVELQTGESRDDEIGKKEEWNNGRHVVLVVEDDPDMRAYIGNELSDRYNILLAANGKDALDIIRSQRVDIVISDIMMPIMDGCQLCNAIKSHTELSHIPVILLTAAVGIETRMETLEVAADGYIEKPFSIELLRANITSLFKNREIAYHQFMNSPLSHFNSTTVSNVDQDYMDKLHDIIIKHIADHNLNIEMITDLLGTSKSTLYRKVKANTGLNINEYIRLCRLKQAAEMLSSQKYRINEVAYLVGFSSPSYFATSFQKQFNISPSNFVKRLRGEDCPPQTEDMPSPPSDDSGEGVIPDGEE